MNYESKLFLTGLVEKNFFWIFFWVGRLHRRLDRAGSTNRARDNFHFLVFANGSAAPPSGSTDLNRTNQIFGISGLVPIGIKKPTDRPNSLKVKKMSSGFDFRFLFLISRREKRWKMRFFGKKRQRHGSRKRRGFPTLTHSDHHRLRCTTYKMSKAKTTQRRDSTEKKTNQPHQPTQFYHTRVPNHTPSVDQSDQSHYTLSINTNPGDHHPPFRPGPNPTAPYCLLTTRPIF